MLSEIRHMEKTIFSEHGYQRLWVTGRDEKSEDFAQRLQRFSWKKKYTVMI